MERFLNNRVNLSLAALPGLMHEDAARTAHTWSQAGLLSEPLLGQLSLDHVQLVPQSHGRVNEELVEHLRREYPETQFRLHANVRVLSQHVFADLSGLHLYPEYFSRAARMSQALGASAYSAHSGTREQASMSEMLESARRLADLFGCPVAVEGQYPNKGNTLLVNSWEEYREVFDSGVPYALDLSHLNILAEKSGVFEVTLVQEMLSCERCIEVHVSDNDGQGDQHRVCDELTWWFGLMRYTHPQAVVFSEGNHRLRLKEAENNLATPKALQPA